MRRLVAALAAAALLLAPVAGAEAKPPAKRAQVVCFTKTVWVKGRTAGQRGRLVRKRVCRPRRAAAPARRFEPAVPTPGPEVAALPDVAPLPLPAVPATAVAAAPSAAPSVVVCADASPWVGATAEDVAGVFRYRLSRTCVRAGTVWFDVRNNDLQEHDLWVASPTATPREVVGLVDPAQTDQGSAALTAGEWTLYCAVPGHGAMARALTVTPAG